MKQDEYRTRLLAEAEKAIDKRLHLVFGVLKHQAIFDTNYLSQPISA